MQSNERLRQGYAVQRSKHEGEGRADNGEAVEDEGMDAKMAACKKLSELSWNEAVPLPEIAMFLCVSVCNKRGLGLTYISQMASSELMQSSEDVRAGATHHWSI